MAYPTSDVLDGVVTNPFFLGRVYGFSGGENLEELLGATDEGFQDFDRTINDHGREVADDEDLVTRLFTLPIYLPGGSVWELELYDNGEHAGVTHWLRVGGDYEPLQLAVVDPHPRGPAVRWEEAERLFAAIERDERNRASGVASVAPLLLWAATGPAEDDDREQIEARLAAAWSHTGLVTPEIAQSLASTSARTRRSEWKQHAKLGWISTSEHSLRRPGEEDGWSDSDFRRFREVLARC